MPVGYSSRIFPAVIAVLAVLLVYRRLRRSFGRQPIRPVYMGLRIAILTLLGAAIVPTAWRSPQFLAADVAGFAAGLALGVWGVRRTRFIAADGRLMYVPHTYTGIVVSLLLVGRLAYRWVEFQAMNAAAGPAATAPGFAAPAMLSNPLTVGLLSTVIGYYVYYYAMVLWKSRHLRLEDAAAAQIPTPGSDLGPDTPDDDSYLPR